MRIRQQLNRLPIGGATPLAAGLQKAGQVINQARRKDRAVEPLLVLISDGEATTPGPTRRKRPWRSRGRWGRKRCQPWS